MEHSLNIWLQATVVTANGSILKVNETENSDLFWGIRGGGTNFGVVTEFALKLHPQRRTLFCGHIVFTEGVFERLMEVTKEFWLNIKENEGMLQAFSAAPDGSGSVSSLLLFLTCLTQKI